ncbi:NAD(P)-dependent oxidoreductase [Photobacterium rosenbergii]|uniref:NAD(P)-dependent oxidoreductase n=1 Tax=Photobacterium rosenbergii TaxID=294936 RepID=UPI001C99BBEA|nr:NAD(P)-dependent oxidoreductase [Photobacterium rosenbergii]MBY5944645.1 hypothetical protein [Photobacterium rosenbergii]
MNIYIHPVLNTDEANYLRQQLPEHVSCLFNDGSNDFAKAKNAEIAIGNFNTDWIGDMAQLHTLLLDSVGTDNFNGYQWPTNRTITVCNLAGFFSGPVAEEILAGILASYRQLPALNKAKENKLWAKDDIRFTKRLVAEAKVLVLGYGSIGQQAAKLLSAFGAQVTTFDNADMEQQGKQGLITAASQCDILISTIPATAQTENLIDVDIFEALPDNAVFANVGRGQVVNEDDLLRKAQQHPAFTAWLDVTKQEPLPASSQLWEASNIYLTQHTGGGSATENLKKIDVYVSQIHRLLAEKPLHNTVNF